jgi:hypothetical protein
MALSIKIILSISKDNSSPSKLALSRDRQEINLVLLKSMHGELPQTKSIHHGNDQLKACEANCFNLSEV